MSAVTEQLLSKTVEQSSCGMSYLRFTDFKLLKFEYSCRQAKFSLMGMLGTLCESIQLKWDASSMHLYYTRNRH
jgi:hypothetical protein